MIFNIITALIATVASIFIIIGLKKGEPYSSLVEDIYEDNMFFSRLYVIGYYLSDNVKIFRLNDNLLRKLQSEAVLIYSNEYAEYYSRLAWSQFLSLALIIVAAGCTIATFTTGSTILIVLLIMAVFVVAIWDMSMNRMSDFLKHRTEECLAELPTMVSKLALMINAGLTLRAAWIIIAESGDGAFYDLMMQACQEMKNGSSDAKAIEEFGKRANDPEIKKFTSAMVQGIKNGHVELTEFLLNQANELMEQKKQLMLQKGETAAGKLVAPLGLTFCGIILIIAAAAMQSMSL